MMRQCDVFDRSMAKTWDGVTVPGTGSVCI